MKERWLYCEGQTDARVLKAIFAALGVDVITESTGGNPGEIARWRRENGTIAASIADRDYRLKADSDSSFADGSMKFLWRRHSIESYLLEPEVVSKAIENIKRSLQEMPFPPPCTENLPENDVVTVMNELVEAGKRIKHKECGCICIHRLWLDLNESLGRIQQRIPQEFSSQNNATEKECVSALIIEAARLANAASDATVAGALTEREISRRYADMMTDIHRADYWHERTFVHEFHGKRLLKQLCRQMNDSYGLRASPSLFSQELINAIESIALTNPEANCLTDFHQLAASIMSI